MADYTHAHVTGRFGLTVGDGVDPDELPDTLYPDPGGTITITPLITEIKATKDGEPITLGKVPYVCTTDSTGHLTFNGRPGVWVADLGGEGVNPVTARGVATYRVKYDLKFDGKPIAFKEKPFHPQTGQVNDITLMTSVEAGGSTPILVGPRGPEGPEGVEGPQGVAGGSDAATAEHVTTGPLTVAALSATFAPTEYEESA